MSDPLLTIGEAAKRADLPVKTIRYYEEIGLVQPLRDTNGYRAFRATDLHKLVFLARGRALGFSIDDCRSLLALWEDQSRASADVKLIARQHLALIDRKLAELADMRATLSNLVETCAGDDRPDCPILKGIAGQSS